MSQATMTATAPPAEDAPVLPQPEVSRRRRWVRWSTRAAVPVAVAVSLFFIHDQLPDLGAMGHVAANASPFWLALTVFCQAASMAAFARVQRRLLGSGGVRLSLPRAISVTYAGNALSTTLPVGPAVSIAFTFRQFRRIGAPARLATAVIVLGGVIMTSAYSVVGLVALLAEPHARSFAAVGLAALALPVATVVLLWRVPRSRATLTRVFGPPLAWMLRPVLRQPLVAQALQVRGTLRLRLGDWGVLTAFALLNWLFDIVSLAAAGRAVGVDVPVYAVALAYFAAQAAGSLFPLLPGGLGAIEGSLAASLVAFGAAAVPATAAVALYRLVSFWGVVSAGYLAWLLLKLGEEGPAGPIHAGVRRVLHTAGSSMAAAACAAYPMPHAAPSADPTKPA